MPTQNQGSKEKKTAFIRARVEPSLKHDVETIFDDLGVSATQVINMLYKQVKRTKALPIELSIPNQETAKVINEARQGKNVVHHSNKKDFFDDLDL